jgi:hypothetical protein
VELSEIVVPALVRGERWFDGLFASRLQGETTSGFSFDDDEGFFVALSCCRHFARRFLNQT